mgnify:CR=1 FL=1
MYASGAREGAEGSSALYCTAGSLGQDGFEAIMSVRCGRGGGGEGGDCCRVVSCLMGREGGMR